MSMVKTKEKKMQVPAGQFKARCLQLMDDVQKSHEEMVITKFGKPVAKLVPIEKKPQRSLFGFLGGEIVIAGDIVGPIGESWQADE